MSYQTVGSLWLDFQGLETVNDYRRELDLKQAVTSVSFESGGAHYTRQVFASLADPVIVVRLHCSRPGGLNLRIGFTSPEPAQAAAESDSELVLSGTNTEQQGIAAALRFEARVQVQQQGGVLRADGDGLRVEGAQSVTLRLAMATSYRRFDDVSGDPTALNRAALAALQSRSDEALFEAHRQAYAAQFSTVSLDLGASRSSLLPTDERVRQSAQLNDPQLAALYFQYGRYLLISCSQPGTQPANLQGIWNEKLNAPWGGKYTININTEMNYWPADPVALGFTQQPLLAMVEDLAITGAETARRMYGARGWVVHHNTDLWRAAAPIDGAKFGMWPMGGAWLCCSLWRHYDYSRDRAFLSRLYPLLQGSVAFFMDTLVQDEQTGWWMTSPSMSPEHNHHGEVSICKGPAMDQQILRDLFAHYLMAAEQLGETPPDLESVRERRAALAPDKIGAQGQLQEWQQDWDAQAPEPHHRHVSHLYAVYPSDQINIRDTPALAEAAKVTLNERGDESTGWAIAWRINLWARLGDAERAHHLLSLLLRPDRTYPNMFDAHPPFQIDGNFGGTAAIAQMLLQSWGGTLFLLPALPSGWPSGQVTGLQGRGAVTVDLRWDHGELLEASLNSPVGGSFQISYRGVPMSLTLEAGKATRLIPQGGGRLRLA